MWLNKFDNIDDISGCEGGNIMQTLDGGFLISAVAQVDVSDNHYDHYLFKFDASGALSWSKQLDYKDFDFFMRGFQQANGNFILYNQLAEGSAPTPHNRITMSDNGTIIIEESHSDFVGELIYPNGLIRSSTGNILYLSNGGNGTNIQVSDKDLNKITNTNFPDDEFNFMNQAVGSQEGYYTLDKDGNFAKFDNQFNLDWLYTPPKGGKAYYRNMPVELSNARYAVLEKGVPQENGDETIALSVIEEGGDAIARGQMNGGKTISIRKVIANSNDNIIVISWGSGLLVESYTIGN